ncbi:serine hydrolase domain-containing protein [Yoonia sediminilitoris]|uniref:CubicO group peptidase (Beta-lactamase class C family) n=1 Tax=Yoonia sediminilitoris TaxID=1286148 RepID=A0A2T6KHA7_9RHOB|nr:serine hydrolase [Yoonia sediminilitoris]PUB14887.1 CubicO group peptidase (beta-lactamase class C family) [Yoonia sediminilitoris]RCW95604.1 CubicO group peptidase (beta-lactamase class C family) [Yoonia sediminilitoris]
MNHLNRRLFLAGATALTTLPARAQAADWGTVAMQARSLDQCHALLVQLNGRSVLSEVFRGPGITRAVPIKSVSKTIVAALTGAALDRGDIPALDATLADLAPQLIPAGADPRVGRITVENLVTMQAGLERTSGSNYGGWVSSSDWVANALSRPFVAEPGERMLYSTGSFHVLGAVLSEISGQSLLALARARLGDPLGIEIPAWTRDPQGRYLGGNEMALRLPAMARFGELYRNGGRWGGVQVLSKDWVDRSLRPVTRSPYSGLSYGYGWFLGRAGGDDYALARGYGGQIICISPKLGLTVAITSDPTRPARSGGYFGQLKQLIEAAIMPAARAQMG